MRQNRRTILCWPLLAAAAAFAFSATVANAEPRTVRIAQQFGISYVPLTIMKERHLLESEGKKLGLDLKTEWTHFSNGAAMNNALLSGSLDFASGGVGPLVTAWARTKGKQDIKGICALNTMPLYLNTINPNVKTIKDFTAKDKIALPAVRVSMQAVILQMAALKLLGKGHEHDLDKYTVSLSHPDGLAQMMSFKSEITGHFTSAPFMYVELKNPKVHRVLNSYDVFGGPHTFNVVWAMGNIVQGQPETHSGLPVGDENCHEGNPRRSARRGGSLGQVQPLQAAGSRSRRHHQEAGEHLHHGAEAHHGGGQLHGRREDGAKPAEELEGHVHRRHP